LLIGRLRRAVLAIKRSASHPRQKRAVSFSAAGSAAATTSILAIYSRCVNAELAIEEVLGTTFPWYSS
jgi:hypothetical protein